MVNFYLDDYNLISIKKAELVLNENLKLFKDGKEIDFHLENGEDRLYLHLFEDYDEKCDYKGSINGMLYDIMPHLIVQTKRFEKEYKTDLNKLGCFLSKDSTIFRVWSPLSSVVYLSLDTVSYKMNYVGKGVYELKFSSNLENHYYHYIIKRGPNVYSFSDPFSYVDKDKKDSYIIDINKINKDKIKPSKKPKTVIYECNVRDFSSDTSANFKYPKKFKAFTEEGLRLGGLPIGLDYIKSLGVSHIQLMPINSFSLDNGEYNWGYNPLTYNTLHKDYVISKNPYEELKEFKDLVNICHKNNIRVNIDVVFNHVYRVEKFNLGSMLPYYFFRYKNDKLGNASGCGNEFRSEAYFSREYLKLIIKRFIEIYDIDGLRFDLMGILDEKTINEIYDLGTSLKEDFMVYGEGWNMGDIVAYEDKAIKENAYKMKHIGFFNDIFRESIRGGWIDDRNAYMLGEINKSDNMKKLLCGSLDYGFDVDQTINYVECHDNYSLYDKISRFFEDEDNIKRVSKFALSLVLIARGLPFIHMGQEFLRTKHGIDNSYNAGDSINMIDWNRKNRYMDICMYLSDLIKLRNKYEEFSKDDVLMSFEDYYEVLIWHLNDLTIFINACGFEHTYNDENTYQIIFDLNGFTSNKTNEIKIEPFSILVTKKVSD